MSLNSKVQQISIPTEKMNVSIEKMENSAVEKKQEKEIEEVIEIINDAILHLDRALSKISTASDWGLYDTLCGGGCLSSLIKQGNMDDANREMVLANKSIEKLKEEIKDVENVDTIEVSELLSFMDAFFDNIFSDIMVQNKIAVAERNCRKARNQLVNLRKELKERLEPKPISEIQAEKKIKKDKEEDIKAAFESCTDAIEALQKTIRPLEKAIDFVGDDSIICCFGCLGYLFTESKIDNVKMKMRYSNRVLDILNKRLKNVSIDTSNRSEYLKYIEISNDILSCNGTSFDNEAGRIFSQAKSSCLKSIKEIESIRDELKEKVKKRNYNI